MQELPEIVERRNLDQHTEALVLANGSVAIQSTEGSIQVNKKQAILSSKESLCHLHFFHKLTATQC